MVDFNQIASVAQNLATQAVNTASQTALWAGRQVSAIKPYAQSAMEAGFAQLQKLAALISQLVNVVIDLGQQAIQAAKPFARQGLHFLKAHAYEAKIAGAAVVLTLIATQLFGSKEPARKPAVKA